ncbi:MAG: LamG-like jellyroll fold domain-containing protein [Kofleriaceae bacterium]
MSLVLGCGFSATAVDPDARVDAADLDAALDTSPVARVRDGLIALWAFDETSGATISDTSGVLPPITLSISDPAMVAWADSSLRVNGGVDINSAGVFNRLVPKCKVSDEVTLEAWVTAANIEQRGQPGFPARIVAMTVKNIAGHLISLDQDGSSWGAHVLTKTAGVDLHGGPMLTNGTVDLTLTHLVVTSTPSQRQFFVNGVAVSDAFGGLLDDWKDTFFVTMAGDPNRRNTWLGTIHLVAVYDRALPSSDVMTNYVAGP